MIRINAPAKLNLFLHITGRRDNAYHELQTLFQLIDWQDTIDLLPTSDGQIKRLNSVPGVANSEDLSVRAAKLLRRRYPGPEGINIRLHKKIPIGSGLGGGSSDAASTLLAANQIWQLGLDCNKLVEIGSTLGADVAVFIKGKTAWGEGIGEVLTKVNLSSRNYVVVVPPVAVSTQRVYREYRRKTFRKKINFGIFQRSSTFNDLEESACRLYPEVAQTLEWLRQKGNAKMSGSGGAVFLEIQDLRQGKEILADLPPGCQGRICRGLEVSSAVV